MARPRLGETLVKLGYLDAERLQAALGNQKQWGKLLGRTLFEMKFCSAEQILAGLSRQTGIQAIDLDHEPLGAPYAQLLPRKAAEAHKAVPLRAEGKRHEILVVAIIAPAGLEQLDALTAASGRQRVVPFLAWDDAIERALGRVYRGDPFVPPTVIEKAPVAAAIDAREQEFDMGDAAPAAAADPLAALQLSEGCLHVIHTASRQHQVSPVSVIQRILESWASKQKLS
jgi:hypothetical protein